ncbi:hypothetical protein [Mesorhizobium sp. f-mel]
MLNHVPKRADHKRRQYEPGRILFGRLAKRGETVRHHLVKHLDFHLAGRQIHACGHIACLAIGKSAHLFGDRQHGIVDSDCCDLCLRPVDLVGIGLEAGPQPRVLIDQIGDAAAPGPWWGRNVRQLSQPGCFALDLREDRRGARISVDCGETRRQRRALSQAAIILILGLDPFSLERLECRGQGVDRLLA